MLVIENLSKCFANVKALQNVSFKVSKGEVCGLLGPNGAGKTTLLRIINGILLKDSGSVRIDGQEASLKTAKRIGYLPEERGLYENMTVREQILFFGEIKGAKKNTLKCRMKEYLDLFGLNGRENSSIKELSKGNQQKVQIISTLCFNPEMVILDEPFSGFDPINSSILQNLIVKLKNEGTSVILATHNMHAVEEMCESIVLMNQGKILLHGNIDNVKQEFKTGNLLIQTHKPLPLESIQTADNIVAIAEAEHNHKPTKNNSYIIRPGKEIRNIDIINLVSKYSDIISFSEIEPSLNEIFIKLVNPSATQI